MTKSENLHWHNLVSLSAATFDGDDAPPYGFTTRFLSRQRAEAKQRELIERIGLRAIFASLAMLVVAAAVTFGVDYANRSEFDPGLRSMVQAEHLQLS